MFSGSFKSSFLKTLESDVKLSNSTQNTAAAMDFLKGLKSRKAEEPKADLNAKIVFSRPDRQKPREKSTDEKSSLKEKTSKPGNIGGAIRMDEYVVGAPKAKVQKGEDIFHFN